MSALLIIATAALCNNIALLLLKLAGKNIALTGNLLAFVQKSGFFILGGAFFYALSFILTIKILADNSFLSAVPTFIGINFLFTVIISLFFFKEPLALSSIAGICLILSGVWLISTNSI
ncbi:MAG: multidrug transporter EmrE-like cation transporter [Oleiphilaceae bacterium]|jgi:multidrug transporter EmrE-like cation transporter